MLHVFVNQHFRGYIKRGNVGVAAANMPAKPLNGKTHGSDWGLTEPWKFQWKVFFTERANRVF